MLLLLPGTPFPFLSCHQEPAHAWISAQQPLLCEFLPEALPALTSDEWRDPPSSLLLWHWLCFSLCGLQCALGSVWLSLCQHLTTFATHLPGTHYMPGTGLGTWDVGVSQKTVSLPWQGLQPSRGNRSTPRDIMEGRVLLGGGTRGSLCGASNSKWR